VTLSVTPFFPRKPQFPTENHHCNSSRHASTQSVVITSHLLPREAPQGSKVTANEALEAAEKADVIIYSVALIDDSYYWAQGLTFGGNSVLKKLSEGTGGQMVRVNHMRETGAAFREIANELRAQYFLGYSPSSKLRDGSFRKIRVRVHNRNYRVRVRRGYYAQAK
jgi:Ca-activated chloride channel homolog